MSGQKVHSSNWQHTHLICGELHAYLSYGADYDDQGKYREIFYLNLTEGHSEDAKVLKEQVFYDLNAALETLNSTYPHFEVKDLSNPAESGSCGSCVAH